jgi:EAL domain-containing protein (putative c-di-GMP-specific phosphodiesterase class I)
MRRLRDMGVRISVDDFGTGYSSLSYLKKLPLNTLKIDRSFITDVVTDSDAAAIVNTIISLGRILRLEVVAEGIENEQQMMFLQNHGCMVGQGYYFAYPLSAHDFAEWINARNRGDNRDDTTPLRSNRTKEISYA